MSGLESLRMESAQFIGVSQLWFENCLFMLLSSAQKYAPEIKIMLENWLFY